MSNVEYLKELVIKDPKERVDRTIPFPTLTPTPPLKKKSTCLGIRSICTKDLHTMNPYLDCEPVPFSLFHKPKEIIREDPYAIQHQHPFVKPPQGEEHKEVQRTRPRLVMTPAVSLDDADDRLRGIIIKDNYVSCYQRTYNKKHGKHACASLPNRFSPAKPIYLRSLKHYNVPFEWRRETLKWEGQQLRCTEDLNVAFWSKKDLYKKNLKIVMKKVTVPNHGNRIERQLNITETNSRAFHSSIHGPKKKGFRVTNTKSEAISSCNSCKATAQIQEMRKTQL